MSNDPDPLRGIDREVREYMRRVAYLWPPDKQQYFDEYFDDNERKERVARRE